MREVCTLREGEREKAMSLGLRIREAKDLSLGERAALQETLSHQFLIALGHKPH